ncbi:hypothetical protein FACS1894189_6910 [Planctomycetales bacterium]|nr:hypothetical protein FACS1894189_6910 [Planctomycetales bacterium]
MPEELELQLEQLKEENQKLRQQIALLQIQDVAEWAEGEAAAAVGKAKSTFLANISHEIRTPLNAVIGMTQIGLDSEDKDKKDYCLLKVSDASRHLLGVIDDILDMSKIDAGKFSLHYADANLGKMLGKVTDIIKFRVQEKQQDYVVKLDEHLPEVISTDEQRLNQVLINLVSNAVKFTPDKGKIILSVKLLKEVGDLCEIQFSIKDSGIGIAKEQQERLFQQFEQADNTTSRKFGGTGLGLAISKKISEMMGGQIQVESVVGQGSTFSFTIKVHRKGKMDIGERARITSVTLSAVFEKKQQFVKAVPAGIFADKFILIAEDVKINREIIRAQLKPTQVQIDFAENGLIAVQKFSNNPKKYDLIFMDMQMPELDGLEAAEKIRSLSDPWANKVPIIAMTANVFQEDIENCIKAGMNDHIGKPLDIGLVVEKMRAYLAESNISAIIE